MAANAVGFTSGFTSFAVPDADEAKKFYQETLGLEVRDEMMGMLRLVLPGGTNVLVYPKEDHQPAGYTILNFSVPNIDDAVDQLTAAGVRFEKYDGFNQDEKGIARPESEEQGPPIAWFTDPGGNVIGVMEGAPPEM